ncbi:MULTISPECIES: EpsD family peptidyl-prolyl cis-trans isomerase [unclassified Duganella]|uniref:EpsD family peptidyl-prolyl cis-trans isomerase n=1 Tax=unclassified Duganella TaxID=2636909 RepID=UPI0027D92BDF|nr:MULTISPECIES: EpsD family peptidyl-prolyl cis-trans isomerase [unclassified Duganella]
MNQQNVISAMPSLRRSGRTSQVLALALVAALGLSACGDKAKKSGQALVSVNGEEITISQLNEELQRANVPPAQQEQAGKQLLESLVDRQLLLNEAVKEKLDRDPKVVQGIERAKALIIAQAYMQKHLSAPAKPTRAEVEDYYAKHPAFFAQRKMLELRELSIASSDMSAELKAAIDSAKSLDAVASWMDEHKVKYERLQVSRSSGDLPPELGSRLLALPKGQLFIVKEGARSLLIVIADTRDTPVTLEQSAPQIEQVLMAQRNKDAAGAELKRLRGAAKIEYLDKKMEPNAPPAAAAPAASAAASASASASATDESTARGVAGLK